MTDRVDPPGPRHSNAPHVFVADLGAPVLDDGDRRHLERSLRLRPGDALTVGDGRGRWRTARFGDDIEPTSGIEVIERRHPALTVAFAVVKGNRSELVVQKLTELGVDSIVPFLAGRSVVRWDEGRREKNRARLERIVREAAMQSGRVWIPSVSTVGTFGDVAVPGAALADRGGKPPSLETPCILVGPEGGWTPDERSCGLPCVGLGDGVLRAETAAIAAATLLAGLRSGIVARRSAG